MPVCQALFGEDAASYVLIYDMAHSLIFWTLGVYLMSRDGSEKQPFFSGKTLKKLLSPGLLGLLAAILSGAAGSKITDFCRKDVQIFRRLVHAVGVNLCGLCAVSDRMEKYAPE